MTSPQTLAAVGRFESSLTNRWVRWMVPSLSDLFFAAMIVILFLSSGAAGWESLLVDGDAGWHIRTGEYILDHHTIPHHDLYSFSKPGAPWYAWEWLTDVLNAYVHRLAGLKGIVLMAGVVIAAFCTTLIRRMASRGANLLVAMAIALFAVGTSWIHFLARPHIFTLLLLSISMWILEIDRERPSRKVWWLVPLTALWTNLHGGFLVLIVVLGLAALGTAIEAWMRRAQWSQAIRYGALTLACSAVTLLNPYGYMLHVHVAQYLRSDWIRSVVQEFQSPSFRNENMMQFEFLLLVGLVVAGALLRRRRVVEALWIVVLAHMSLGSVRHAPLYATVAAPIIAAEISSWWIAWTCRARKGSVVRILNDLVADQLPGFRRFSAWPVFMVVALMLTGRPIPWPVDFPEKMFPAKMVHAHASEIFGARVMTTDQWGDFLIYTNPAHKVFLDGRSDFYGPEIGNQAIHAINGYPDWEHVMGKYGFTVALLPVENALTQLLKQRPDWRILDEDDKRILLVRKGASVPPPGITLPEPRF